MATAKLTLIGLYNWDNHLFDDLTLPAGIDKDTLVDNILIRSGDFESLYCDADFVKAAIGVWSRKWSRTFEKWVKALSLTYDPISNYDRHEEWETDDQGSQNSRSHDTNSTSNTLDTKVSAYNDNSLVPDGQSTSSAGATSTTTLDGNHANLERRKGRAWGNIGVTTSQQMLQAELDLASWNLYEHITDIFLSEFIVPVF